MSASGEMGRRGAKCHCHECVAMSLAAQALDVVAEAVNLLGQFQGDAAEAEEDRTSFRDGDLGPQLGRFGPKEGLKVPVVLDERDPGLLELLRDGLECAHGDAAPSEDQVADRSVSAGGGSGGSAPNPRPEPEDDR